MTSSTLEEIEAAARSYIGANGYDPDPEQIIALVAELRVARKALTQAEACMSIVEPRRDKAEYLRILGVVRHALNSKEP